jgi:hypothetical protein
LIGTQNGGLTLLSRILHRHPDTISVTGDHHYWAGEDEAQDALADVLPEDFGWRRIDLPGFPSRNHSWVYGSDGFLPHYRRRAGEVDVGAAARYRSVVEGVLRQHGPSKRFIDKSQSLTLRVGAVHAALANSPPRFVLISRNPYAVIWSQATRNGVLSKLDLSISEKVRLGAEHWRNSFAAALEDAQADPNIHLRHWRFEDILEAPERTVEQICAFAELPWRPSILPQSDDRIPWGSRWDAFNTRKWYPLRPSVNDRYLAEIPDWAANQITRICGDLASRLGYAPPPARARE